MPTLLSLPQELRDEIYSYILAPTGTITLIPHMEAAIRHGSAPVTILDRTIKSSPPQARKLYIDIRILRVCKQIYEECRDMLFKQNTFFFRTTWQLERVLDEMGQKQSRRIEKIAVDFSKGAPSVGIGDPVPISPIIEVGVMNRLRKAVRKSLSRARHGNLRQLTIHLKASCLYAMAGLNPDIFQQFLKLGRDTDDWGSLSVSIDIKMLKSERAACEKFAIEWDFDKTELDFALMSIGSDWGGNLFWNGEIIWKDRCRIKYL